MNTEQAHQSQVEVEPGGAYITRLPTWKECVFTISVGDCQVKVSCPPCKSERWITRLCDRLVPWDLTDPSLLVFEPEAEEVGQFRFEPLWMRIPDTRYARLYDMLDNPRGQLKVSFLGHQIVKDETDQVLGSLRSIFLMNPLKICDPHKRVLATAHRVWRGPRIKWFGGVLEYDMIIQRPLAPIDGRLLYALVAGLWRGENNMDGCC